MDKKKLTNGEIEQLIDDTVISPEIQAEYISYHDNFDNDIALAKDQIAENGRRLVLKRTPLADKKHILFRLAHTPVLSAHNAITRYLKEADDDLLTWAVLAWKESHELVLNAGMQKVFGDSFEPEPLVMSGLGGDKEGRLRYCFVVSAINNVSFSRVQENDLRETLEKTDCNHKTHTESIVVKDNYALITVCIGMDVAPATYIEEAIYHANIPEIFLRCHYYAVNTHVPTEEEIDSYLAELNDESLPDSFL
jgi:hypothetical protein